LGSLDVQGDGRRWEGFRRSKRSTAATGATFGLRAIMEEVMLAGDSMTSSRARDGPDVAQTWWSPRETVFPGQRFVCRTIVPRKPVRRTERRDKERLEPLRRSAPQPRGLGYRCPKKRKHAASDEQRTFETFCRRLAEAGPREPGQCQIPQFCVCCARSAPRWTQSRFIRTNQPRLLGGSENRPMRNRKAVP